MKFRRLIFSGVFMLCMERQTTIDRTSLHFFDRK